MDCKVPVTGKPAGTCPPVAEGNIQNIYKQGKYKYLIHAFLLYAFLFSVIINGVVLTIIGDSYITSFSGYVTWGCIDHNGGLLSACII